jgi:hypothetical protein
MISHPARLLACLLALLTAAGPAPAAKIELLAGATLVSQTAAGSSLPLAISADGRYVLLRSSATNLIAGVVDENGSDDLYLRDVQTGTLTLITHRHGQPARTADGGSQAARMSGGHSQAAVAAGGEFVLYTSWAGDLVAGVVPAPYSTDVYLWSRATGSSTLVSRLAANPLQAAGKSRAVALTPDGAFALFASEATGLAAGMSDDNGDSDVFLFSRASGEVSLISVAANGTAAGNRGSDAIALSADGGAVLFDSWSWDLAGGSPGTLGVYLRRVAQGTTQRFPSTAHAGAASLTPDGRFALILAGDLVVWDCQNAATRVVAGGDTFGAALSADGQRVLYYQEGHAYLHLGSGSPLCLSCSADGGWPRALSPDGNVAVFDRHVVGDSASPVFFHDVAAGVQGPVSRRYDGQSTSAAVDFGGLSADGQVFAFAGREANLDSAFDDRNGNFDAFVFLRGAGGVELLSPAASALPVATTLGLPSWPTGQSADGDEVLFRGPAYLPEPQYPTDHTAAWAYHLGTGARRLLSPLPGQPATPVKGMSSPLALARDGRALLDSFSPDLVPGSSPGLESQLYLYSPASQSYRMITAKALQPGVGTAGTLQDIRFDRALTSVVFASTRQELVAGLQPGAQPNALQLYSCDLAGPGCSLLSATHHDPLTMADSGVSAVIADPDLAKVAFTSRASDLVANGASGLTANAYTWTPGGGIALISRSAGNPAAEANGDTETFDVSSGGRFVLASSRATDLVAGVVDGNNAPDVFVYDSAFGTWELVSASAAGPTFPANGGSRGMAISANGRFVLFRSSATDLVAGQIDPEPPLLGIAEAPFDLFLLDRNTGEMRLVSHLPGDSLAAAGYVYYGQLSEDGSRVALLSTSPALLPGSPGGIVGTYLWDAEDDELQTLFQGKGGPAVWPGAWPIFYDVTRFFDGRTLPFASYADNVLPRGDHNGTADAYVMKLDGLFRDGFESGDTSAWSSSVP